MVKPCSRAASLISSWVIKTDNDMPELSAIFMALFFTSVGK